MNFRWPARGVFAVVAVAMVVSTIGCSGNVADSRSDGLELEEGVQPEIKISGMIVDADGRPLEGVMVQLDRASKASTTTASNGTYEFLALHRGAYSVTPSLVGCSFEPPTVILTGLKTDAVVDFRGTGANCRSVRDAGAADAAVDVRAADAPADVRPVETGAVDAPTDRLDGAIDTGTVDACIRKTCMSAGVMCGPLADGCGAILQCGSCPSGQTCNIAGQCVCQPITACPAGKNCGAVPDGCGGTIDCGTCTAPQICGGGGVPNVCGSMAAGCELDTLSCVRTRDKPNDPPSVQCSQCLLDNGCFDLAQQGATCEDTPGTAPVACQMAIMSSTPVSETKICLATLDRIFLSQCAATFQLTPCLCGTTDAAACLAGTAPPNGPLLSIYQCELGATVPEIGASFTDQSKGVGQANALAQCAGAFGCNCF